MTLPFEVGDEVEYGADGRRPLRYKVIRPSRPGTVMRTADGSLYEGVAFVLRPIDAVESGDRWRDVVTRTFADLSRPVRP